MPEPMTFLEDRQLRIGSCDFYYSHPLRRPDVPEGHLGLNKERAGVEAYADLAQHHQPTRIVELGINEGGGTGMLNELFRPERLVAIELAEETPPALSAYISDRNLGEVVRPHFGVDQADRTRVAAIVEQEFGGEPIDLVIDDASHRYGPTLASFETLFPRLAPGGLYIIEDWRWHHSISTAVAEILKRDHPDAAKVRATIEQQTAPAAPARPEDVPLSRLVFELLLVHATSDLIDRLEVMPDWAVARKGSVDLDPDGFRLVDHYYDHFEQLGDYGLATT